jgi:hypothetical protein
MSDRVGSHRSEVIRGISEKKTKKGKKFKENKKLQKICFSSKIHFFKN